MREVRVAGIVLGLTILAGLSAPAWTAEESRPAPIRVRGRVLTFDSGAPKGARAELYLAAETYDAALLRLKKGRESPPIASVRPSADGTFELEAPESGLYRVVVRADKAVSMEYPLLPLAEDADLAPIQMIPGSPSPVQLLGAGGRPLGGVDVRTMSPEFPPGWSFQGWRRTEESVRTGKDGKAVFQASRHEGLNLYVIHSDFLGLAAGARQEAGLPDRVEVLARPARPIEVRDAEGRPVAGALVRWRSWPVGVTGPDGRLWTALPGPEEPPLTVEGPGGERAQVPRAAAAAGDQPLVVRLGRPEVVAGRVVDAASKSPIAGALVWAAPSSPPVRTDAAGRFRLTLPQREIQLEAVAPGYLRSERQPVPRTGAGVVLSLRPAAALEGRVEDPQGNPVSWAYLSIPAPGRPQSRRGTGVAWSRSDGRFRLPGLLPRGSYEITASSEGFLQATVQARTAPAGRPSAPVKIVLGAGQTAVGRIVDEAGQPVAGALLEMGIRGSVEVPAAFQAVSDAAGRFEIRGLPLGLYMLLVDHPGFAPSERAEVNIASGPAADLGTIALQPEAVIEGQVTNRRRAPVEGAEAGIRSVPHLFVRVPPSMRTGRDGRFRLGGLRPGVRYDLEVAHPDHPPAKVPGVEAPTAEPIVVELAVARRIAGRVVGSAGEPVPNASLSSVREQEIGYGDGGFSTSRSVETVGHTDLRGEFRTDSLPPGTFDLEVSAPGYQSREVKGLTLTEDRDLEGVEIVLERQALLEGRVLTSAGEPFPDVQIHAFPEAPLEKRRLLLHEISSSTDAAGSYRIALPPGSYKIAAFAQGQRVERSQIVRPGSNHLDLVIPDGQEVSGRVIDEAGDPVGGASVSLQSSGTTWSEADGSFVMRGVGDGTHTLTANREGLGRAAAEVVVAGGPVSGIELQLSNRAGTLLTGRLLGLSPESLREARVNTWGGQGSGPARVDPDGSYRISNLSPGEWRVTAHAGILHAEGKVLIEPGTPEAVLDLEFPPSQKLVGRILVDGQPLGGAELTLFVEKRRAGGRYRTGYDGTFTIPDAPVASSALLIQQPEKGFGYILPLMGLTESREILLDIATGNLRGKVTAATGEPVPDAVILVRSIHEALDLTFSGPTGRTDEAGDFEIRSLAPGTYEVEVQKRGATLSKTRAVVTSGGSAEVEVQLVH